MRGSVGSPSFRDSPRSGSEGGLAAAAAAPGHERSSPLPEANAMGSETEKRREDRHGCDASIDWAYFNKPDFYRAHLLNVSPSGGYFECEQRIIPGASLFIRLHHCQACNGNPAIRDCMRSTALGEVKWCRELPDQKTFAYGVGIRYHVPV
jgi:hypothetical protein